MLIHTVSRVAVRRLDKSKTSRLGQETYKEQREISLKQWNLFIGIDVKYR